jgi:hypothetical protein
MAILSIFVFGATLATSVYAIWATVRPELARIIDLLSNGPVATQMIAAPAPARSSLRNVRVQAMTLRSTRRAAA